MDRCRFKQLFLKISVLFGMGVLLAACAGSTSRNTSTPTPIIQSRGTGDATATVGVTPTPATGSRAQGCPAAENRPGYWDTLLSTRTSASQVENVTCSNLKGDATFQALVTVRHQGSGSLLDVYVYDNLNGASPTRIFQLLNLYRGDARISGSHTVLTAEVDQNSSANIHRSEAQLTPDLAREFQWSSSAGTLVQIVFPGIFPDITRYQAEADQAAVNQGQQPWKLSAISTAQAFGASLLKWSPNAPASIVSGGGPHDARAVVSLRDNIPGGNTVTLTMTRLNGNTNGGLWLITNVTASGLAITRPQIASVLSAPAAISGGGNAFEGIIGPVSILDHLYTSLGQTSARGAIGNGPTTFTASLPYQPTFKGGAEEGLIMLATENNASGGIGSAVMVKVLIQ